MKAKDKNELLRVLTKSHILVAADIDFEILKDIDVEVIISRVVENFNGSTSLQLLDNNLGKKIVEAIESEKAPVPIEVLRPSEYKPPAADIGSDFQIWKTDTDRIEGGVKDFVDYFNDRLNRTREILKANNSASYGLLNNIDAINKFSAGREVSIAGIVSQKITTKNGNVMLTLEDESGSAKVIFMNGSSDQAKELFIKASTIVEDEVIVVKGKFSHPFVMAKDLVWPDIPIRNQKTTKDDIAISFISDTHGGSKYFMERHFANMIKWLNGESERHRAMAGKIKYMVIGGDIVDGVGVYPNQELSLSIPDIYTQYKTVFNFLEAIPDYIEVFILPGNHDAGHRAEPQPIIAAELVGDLKKENLHLVTNPCYLRLHGIEVLSYHGTSLDSVIRAVPNMSYAEPAKAMLELLKRRHLSPIHGGNVIVPSKRDSLVIDRVPDVLHMGHVHKNGYETYHGVDIVNSGTWESQTDFQLRQGHIPTPCLMPVLETKKHAFSLIDFNSG
jgi:DNA polymerase II small subunit